MTGVEAAQPACRQVEQILNRDLFAEERELFQELFRALRVIRYGSVLITVHDGHVVEIQKTERIRKALPKQE